MKTKTAIITGASRGIGKQIANHLAKKGYNLTIVARDNKKLTELASELSEYGSRILCLAADLEDANAPAEIVEQTIQTFGKLDVLINNAGIALNQPILESDTETWDKFFHVNARAPYFLCKEAIPHLKRSDRPIIINMGSVVDYKGYINQSIYASSKHALAGFTSALAKEVQDDGIRVHLISPGGVNTEMVSQARPDLNTDELIQPSEIIEIIDFLISYKGKGTIDRIRVRRFNSLAFD